MEGHPQDWLESNELKRLLKEQGGATVIANDPDIAGATIGQVFLLVRGIPGSTPELTSNLAMVANAVAIKLGSMRYHHRRYIEHLYKRFTQLQNENQIANLSDRNIRVCEREMLYEVDAFFHQFKSTLDMLVKTLCIVFGTTPGKLSTYKSHGDGVVKFLKGQLKDSRFTSGRVQQLIEIIEQAKPWLKTIITLRDTLSHYQPYVHFGFGWDAETQRIVPPFVETDIGRLGIEDFMARQIKHLMAFCTQFIAWAVSSSIPIDQHIQVLDEMEKRVIGARWDMDLSRAYWKLATGVMYAYTEADVEKARRLRRQEQRGDL